MRTSTLNALASATLGLLFAASAAPLMAADAASPAAGHAAAEFDFAGAKAKAAADNKLVLVDFSSPN